MRKFYLPVSILILFQLVSCEAFFTSNWFQGAADYSDISVEDAISSGDSEIMQDLFDQVIKMNIQKSENLRKSKRKENHI